MFIVNVPYFFYNSEIQPKEFTKDGKCVMQLIRNSYQKRDLYVSFITFPFSPLFEPIGQLTGFREILFKSVFCLWRICDYMNYYFVQIYTKEEFSFQA